MSAIAVEGTLPWKEGELSGEIERLRSSQNSSDLEQFLKKRIDDADPCCVSCRPRLWNEYGLLQVRTDRIQEAANSFQNALTIDPDNVSALYNLGTLNMRQGDLINALECFGSVLLHTPDHFKALFNSGLCHLYEDRKVEALPYFLKALGLQPDDCHTNYLAGEILMQLERAGEALPHFKAAYVIKLDHFETAMGLAIASLKNGNYEEAAFVCDETLMAFGAATLPLQVKGDAMLALGQLEEAVMCHIDLWNIDLDIRDFVITRLTQLGKDDLQTFRAYKKNVEDSFPEFLPAIQKVVIPVTCCG